MRGHGWTDGVAVGQRGALIPCSLLRASSAGLCSSDSKPVVRWFRLYLHPATKQDREVKGEMAVGVESHVTADHGLPSCDSKLIWT